MIEHVTLRVMGHYVNTTHTEVFHRLPDLESHHLHLLKKPYDKKYTYIYSCTFNMWCHFGYFVNKHHKKPLYFSQYMGLIFQKNNYCFLSVVSSTYLTSTF